MAADRITALQIERVLALHAQGLTTDIIAERLRLTRRSVTNVLRRRAQQQQGEEEQS